MNKKQLLVALIIVLPFFLRMILDRSLWVNDACAYALEAIKIWSCSESPSSIWKGYMNSNPKPPLIAWAGWPLVYLGKLTERFEASLLLLNMVPIVASVYFLMSALKKAYSSVPAITSSVLLVVTPLFGHFGTQFLIQVYQLAIVALFLNILIYLHSRSWLKSAFMLLIGVHLSMLMMVSTPIYVVLPGLAIVVRLFTIRNSRKRGSSALPLILVSLLLTLLCLAWYYENIARALEYANIAVNWRWTGVNHESVIDKLWSLVASLAYHNGPLLPVLFLLAVFFLFRKLRISFVEAQQTRFLEKLSALQLVIVLAVFSLTQNHEPRYLLPLSPYILLLVASLINRLQKVVQHTFLALASVLFIGNQVLAFTNLPMKPTEDYSRVQGVAKVIRGEAAKRVLISTGSNMPTYRDQVKFILFQEFGYDAIKGIEIRSMEFIIMEELAKDANIALKNNIAASSRKCITLIDQFQPEIVILASDSILTSELLFLENQNLQLAEVAKNQLYIHKLITQSDEYKVVSPMGANNQLILYKRKSAL